MLAQVKAVTPLAAGLKKYKAAIPKEKTKLMAIIDEMINDVDSQIKLGASLANPVVNLRQYLDKTIAHSKIVMASGDEKAYSKLWNEDVRGMGTALGKLGKLDPGLKHIHAVCLSYASGDWDAAGKNVTGKITDQAQRTNRVKAAAKEINVLAIDLVRTEADEGHRLNHRPSARLTMVRYPAAGSAPSLSADRSGVEVLRFGVVHDDRVGGLFRVQLELLGQFHVDPARVEQRDDLRSVLEIGAGAVTEGEPCSPIAELEVRLDVLGIVTGHRGAAW
jgi:hypothetical protein